MNSKKMISLALALNLILLSACAVENGTTKDTSISSNITNESSQAEVEYTYDEDGFTRFDVNSVEKDNSYDGKTKIVYLTNYDTTFSTSEDDKRFYDEAAIENRVNEYLSDNGYDFYVDFINNGELDYATDEIHPNLDVYEKMLNDGKQIDLVNTGYGLGFFGGNNDTYHLFVDKGYLEPLNDYFKSDLGSKLYEMIDEINWDQTRVGEVIYGKTTDYSVAKPLVIRLNENVCDEYEVKADSVKSIDDLQSYLQKMSEDGKSGLFLNSSCDLFYEMVDFCKYNGIYINTKTGKAENIFENKEAVEYLKTISDYVQKGYVTNNEGADYLYEIAPAMPLSYNSSKVISKGFLQQKDLSGAVGISSKSENKEKAFELLCLLNTDENLSNIIYNGEENRNYQNKDGKSFLNKNALPFYDINCTPCNPVIAQNNGFDNPEKKEDVRICSENSVVSPFYNEEIPQELKEKADEISAIYDSYYGLFYGDYGEYENLDTALTEANKQLKNAGIDDIIAKINKLK